MAFLSQIPCPRSRCGSALLAPPRAYFLVRFFIFLFIYSNHSFIHSHRSVCTYSAAAAAACRTSRTRCVLNGSCKRRRACALWSSVGSRTSLWRLVPRSVFVVLFFGSDSFSLQFSFLRRCCRSFPKPPLHKFDAAVHVDFACGKVPPGPLGLELKADPELNTPVLCSFKPINPNGAEGPLESNPRVVPGLSLVHIASRAAPNPEGQ